MEKRSGFDIPIAKPCFSGGETELIQSSLDSGWVSQGPLVKQFEEVVADYVGCDQAVAVTSCTTGLHLAALIHGIGPGDEVICPSFSFIATANGVVHSGASVQFCDVEEATFNLDPAAVREFISSSYDQSLINRKTGRKLRAIFLVHQIGIPADIDVFNAIGKEYGITIIEDSACAIGSVYKDTPLGGSGNVGVLSFHPRKVITCGEGGMLLLKDPELAESARVLRAHGASISDFVRHQAKTVVYESYESIGYNYRMTDIQAAIGIKQMDFLGDILAKRRAIGKRYDASFKNLDWLSVIEVKDFVTSWNYQSYPLILNEEFSDCRDEVMNALQESGIATRRGIPPIHKEPAYHEFNQLSLPVAEGLSRRVIFLPIFPTMTDDEVEYVIQCVKTSDQILKKTVSAN